MEIKSDCVDLNVRGKVFKNIKRKILSQIPNYSEEILKDRDPEGIYLLLVYLENDFAIPPFRSDLQK